MERGIQIKFVFLWTLTKRWSDKQKQWDWRQEHILGCSCKTSVPVWGSNVKEGIGVYTHNLKEVVNIRVQKTVKNVYTNIKISNLVY